MCLRFNVDVQGLPFCQAGMIYRPLRERSLSMLEKLASTGIKGTGNDEISLSSLSSSDYSHLPELCNYLIDNYRAKILISHCHLLESMHFLWML